MGAPRGAQGRVGAGVGTPVAPSCPVAPRHTRRTNVQPRGRGSTRERPKKRGQRAHVRCAGAPRRRHLPSVHARRRARGAGARAPPGGCARGAQKVSSAAHTRRARSQVATPPPAAARPGLHDSSPRQGPVAPRPPQRRCRPLRCRLAGGLGVKATKSEPARAMQPTCARVRGRGDQAGSWACSGERQAAAEGGTRPFRGCR